MMQKRMGTTSSHVDQTSFVKRGFIIWKKNTIFLWDTAEDPSDSLLAQVTNHNAGFGSSCLLTELAI